MTHCNLDRPLGQDFSRSTFFHGGGGVRSAPADIHRFARLFIEGGSVDGVRILDPETIGMMLSDQLGDKVPDRWKPRGLSWGFGAAVQYAPGRDRSGMPDQYGWVGGGFAKLWVEPGHGPHRLYQLSADTARRQRPVVGVRIPSLRDVRGVIATLIDYRKRGNRPADRRAYANQQERSDVEFERTDHEVRYRAAAVAEHREQRDAETQEECAQHLPDRGRYLCIGTPTAALDK